MNKLEDLIKFAEEVQIAYMVGPKEYMKSADETKKDIAPFYTCRVEVFEDIAKALTFLKEIINHLDVDIDYTDTDFNDIIHGYYFKLEFDNNNDKDFQIADELYQWYVDETYNDDAEKEWREENGRE